MVGRIIVRGAPAATDNCEPVGSASISLYWKVLTPRGRRHRHLSDRPSIRDAGPPGRGQMDAAHKAVMTSKDEQTDRQRAQAHNRQFSIPATAAGRRRRTVATNFLRSDNVNKSRQAMRVSDRPRKSQSDRF